MEIKDAGEWCEFGFGSNIQLFKALNKKQGKNLKK
jgi:hypothetical protein